MFSSSYGGRKTTAIGKYAAMLPKGEESAFGDTMFLSLAHKMERIDEARQAGHQRLAADLQRVLSSYSGYRTILSSAWVYQSF